MFDISISYNRFKFIGNEFLTWLWFVMDNEPDKLKKLLLPAFTLTIGNRTVLENRSDAGVETVTIKGDAAGLEEGMLALKKGAMVSELNLSYESVDKRWGFTLKGESMNISNLKIPDTGPVQTGEDIEGIVLDKAYLFETVTSLLDRLFKDFITLRVSNRWQEEVAPSVNKWIHSGSAD